MRQLTTDEYAQAGATLTEAFGNGLMLNYVGKKDGISSAQADKLTRLQFDSLSWALTYSGMAYTAGNNYDAIALWLGPGQSISKWSIFRSGMLRFEYLIGSNGRAFYNNSFVNFLKTQKKEILGNDNDNSWYLSIIGTKLSSRGKGYSRELIEPIVKIADSNGQKCYLESSSLKNCDIYSRFGFRRVRDLNIPNADPPLVLYAMVRDPVQKESS